MSICLGFIKRFRPYRDHKRDFDSVALFDITLNFQHNCIFNYIDIKREKSVKLKNLLNFFSQLKQ